MRNKPSTLSDIASHPNVGKRFTYDRDVDACRVRVGVCEWWGTLHAQIRFADGSKVQDSTGRFTEVAE